MRTLLTTGLVLLMTASAAVGQDRTTTDGEATARSGISNPPGLLNERIEEIAVQEVPLDRVLEWISDFTSLNVVVRWQVLEDVGIERDQPITIQVHNLRLSQVLWLILCEAGGPDVRLAYRVDPGLLIISSEEDLERDMLVRVYDVSDLLLQIPRFPGAPQIDLAQAHASGDRSAFARPGGGGREGEDRGGRARQDDIERLIELITEVVEPDSWVRNGGRGTIDGWGNLLVVRSSIRVQQALGGYVEEGD